MWILTFAEGLYPLWRHQVASNLSSSLASLVTLVPVPKPQNSWRGDRSLESTMWRYLRNLLPRVEFSCLCTFGTISGRLFSNPGYLQTKDVWEPSSQSTAQFYGTHVGWVFPEGLLRWAFPQGVWYCLGSTGVLLRSPVITLPDLWRSTPQKHRPVKWMCGILEVTWWIGVSMRVDWLSIYQKECVTRRNRSFI